MKKILNIIGAIGLTSTSTTTLISCEKPNNDKNDKDDKPITPTTKPQQPPENSKGKLITDYNFFENNIDNKYYFVIGKNNNEGKIARFKHDTSDIKK